MTETDDLPWEPPLAGTEAEHLVGALDRLRMTFWWKASGLDAAGLRAQVGKSTLTLGGLLKHLAFVEDFTFMIKLGGEAPGEPWQSVDWDAEPDWVWRSAAEDGPDELYAIWQAAVGRSRARLEGALADGGLDQLVHVACPDGPARQPAQARLRPARGVRSPHRSRRPAPRARGRPGRRGPAGGLAAVTAPRPQLRRAPNDHGTWVCPRFPRAAARGKQKLVSANQREPHVP